MFVTLLVLEGPLLIVSLLLSLLGRNNRNPEVLEKEKEEERVNANCHAGRVAWRKWRRGDGVVSDRNFGLVSDRS